MKNQRGRAPLFSALRQHQREPSIQRDVHTPSIFASSTTMVSKQSTKLHRIVREDLPSGDSGEDYDPEEKGSGHSMAQKPRTSAKATSKQKGKQRGGRRNVGKLSKLPDMPLDILYEVSHRIISVTDDHNGVYDGPFGVCRYSLSSIQWIYYGCHRQARHFATFSQASPRNTFGKPLSITFPRPKDHPRVLRT